MKKIILSVSTLSILIFASCKKDYTCKCEAKIAGLISINLGEKTITDTKKKAQEKCDKKEDEPANFNGIPLPDEIKNLNLKPSCSLEE